MTQRTSSWPSTRRVARIVARSSIRTDSPSNSIRAGRTASTYRACAPTAGRRMRCLRPCRERSPRGASRCTDVARLVHVEDERPRRARLVVVVAAGQRDVQPVRSTRPGGAVRDVPAQQAEALAVGRAAAGNAVRSSGTGRSPRSCRTRGSRPRQCHGVRSTSSPHRRRARGQAPAASAAEGRRLLHEHDARQHRHPHDGSSGRARPCSES